MEDSLWGPGDVGRLLKAGVEFPERDLAWLEERIPADMRFEEAVARRAAREPVAYITGWRAFWNGEFAVTPAVLVPRPESETLLQAALTWVPGGGIRVLDLGVGSGCLLISLLMELRLARGLGVDRSPAALRVASANARRHGVAGRCHLRRGDWRDPVGRLRHWKRYDLVLCNPPYIARGEFKSLEPEVSRAEPRLALDGGFDGLDAYRHLMPLLPQVLRRRGIACIECGAGQCSKVARMAEKAGCTVLEVHCDLAYHDRCLVLRSP